MEIRKTELGYSIMLQHSVATLTPDDARELYDYLTMEMVMGRITEKKTPLIYTKIHTCTCEHCSNQDDGK